MYRFEKKSSGLYLPKGPYDPKPNKIPWNIIAPFLTAVPIFGLILAFLHEIGFTSYYSIPIEIIRLDSTAILKYVGDSLLLAFVFSIGFVIWLQARYSHFRRTKTFWSRIWFIFVVTNVLLGAPIMYVALKGYVNVLGESYYLVILLALVQVILVLPMSKTDRVLLPSLHNTKGLLFLLWLIFSLSFLAYISGSQEALNKLQYFVPSSHVDSTGIHAIVIRIYGDNIICSPLKSDNLIEHSFFIIKLNEPNLILTLHDFDHRLNVEK